MPSPVLSERAAAYLGNRKPSAEQLRRSLATCRLPKLPTATPPSGKRGVPPSMPKLSALLAPSLRGTALPSPRSPSCSKSCPAAVAAEREIRAELSELGSCILPDMGNPFGTLSEYRSVLSEWNRRALALGLLQ